MTSTSDATVDTAADTPAVRRKRANGEASRERILDAAAEIAGERGYEGTSINLVSERSGLPASSIYWHFTNKDELVAAVIDRSFHTWVEQPRAGADADRCPAGRGGATRPAPNRQRPHRSARLPPARADADPRTSSRGVERSDEVRRGASAHERPFGPPVRHHLPAPRRSVTPAVWRCSPWPPPTASSSPTRSTIST